MQLSTKGNKVKTSFNVTQIIVELLVFWHYCSERM